MKKIIFCAILFAATTVFAQTNKSSTPSINWQLMDWQKDGYPGISLEKAYNKLLINKKPLKKIIVAIIDNGLDDKHPDLAGMEWTNTREISDNNIDDDKNGFVDDIHGWNFTANLSRETFEEIREYVRLRQQFENITDTVSLNGDSQYNYWKKILATKNKRMDNLEGNQNYIDQFLNDLQKLQTYWGKKLAKDTLYVIEIRSNHLDSNADSSLIQAQTNLINSLSYFGENTDSITLNFIKDNATAFSEYNNPALKTANTILEKNDPDYFRKEAVGDNPNTNTKKNYGNANISPAESHGTECAGTVAALRNNGIGGNGITNSVEMMTLRITAAHSHADERDKDVANSIRYAVDNGAQVISMSFGKLISPQKKWVDEEVKYAEQKGVLLIAAAGNDASDNDSISFYPIATYADKTLATNFIKVGASTYDSSLVAGFSNYGINTVDVFAPGVNIYTTSINNTFESVFGTSFACPMVAGLAAFIWSYYPTLTYKQVKYCIEKSAIPISILVKKPGTNDKVPFSSLSRTGGIVNAYKAIEIAETMMKKK